MGKSIRDILQGVADGAVSPDDALLMIREKPFEDIGFARVDLHRKVRQGAAEVIYGAGKTPEQISGIVDAMLANGQETILITRLSAESADAVGKSCCLGHTAQVSYRYYADARVGIVGDIPEPDGDGTVLVVTGGTSDIPVAEEAALTASVLGSRTERLYDVGVAGLHRLLSSMDKVMSASVIIAVAGMEGALASVIGGLASCPVVAVPTSVGYGASFGGLSALLSMLNSCASGVTVVNIDNGFGAGYFANMVNHMKSI